MADNKTERLINLTLALLATKRYLKKSEIFRTVQGYDGTADSMDRMFERDKDDLRALGIEIQVGDLDPFFEDIRIGDEQVVADQLDLAAQPLGQVLPAIPVFFR